MVASFAVGVCLLSPLLDPYPPPPYVHVSDAEHRTYRQLYRFHATTHKRLETDVDVKLWELYRLERHCVFDEKRIAAIKRVMGELKSLSAQRKKAQAMMARLDRWKTTDE